MVSEDKCNVFRIVLTSRWRWIFLSLSFFHKKNLKICYFCSIVLLLLCVFTWSLLFLCIIPSPTKFTGFVYHFFQVSKVLLDAFLLSSFFSIEFFMFFPFLDFPSMLLFCLINSFHLCIIKKIINIPISTKLTLLINAYYYVILERI